MVWSTQESGTELLHGEAQAGGGETGKSPSTAADKVGERGCHGARSAQRGRQRVRQENQASDTSVVWDNDRAARSPEWTTSPPELGTRRWAARPPEWRKIHGVLPESGRGSRVATGQRHPQSD